MTKNALVFSSLLLAFGTFAASAEAQQYVWPSSDSGHYVPATQSSPSYVTTNAASRQADLNARQSSLLTETSVELGAQLGYYHYNEPDLGVTIGGANFGATADLFGAFGHQWFGHAEGRFAGGSFDYSGSGTQSGEPNYMAEVRLMAGRDFVYKNFAISPYVGLGYRYLYDDGRGTSSTGAIGYQRESHYLFVPIGLTPRFGLNNGAQLRFNMEYDPLIGGWQNSDLSDYNPMLDNMSNVQSSGYGLRGNIAYQTYRWSFGPYFNYWNINQSKTSCITYQGQCFILEDNNGNLSVPEGDEPHNQTTEYGVQVSYRFH